MDKKSKYLIRGILAFILCYVIYLIGDYMIYGHSTEWKKWKEYTFLFNDSVIQNVDTFLACSDVARNDVFTNFHYISNDSERSMSGKFLNNPKDNAYNVVFWEFKKLAKINIADINFRLNQNLGLLKLKRGEILNSKSDQRVAIHYGFEYKSMNINLDSNSKIDKFISGRKYKGFIGSVTRMSFSNENEKHEIFLDYVPHQKQVLFLVYKSNQRFFIIIIDSYKYLNENIIEILNLK